MDKKIINKFYQNNSYAIIPNRVMLAYNTYYKMCYVKSIVFAFKDFINPVFKNIY